MYYFKIISVKYLTLKIYDILIASYEAKSPQETMCTDII